MKFKYILLKFFLRSHSRIVARTTSLIQKLIKKDSVMYFVSTKYKVAYTNHY